MVTIIVSVFIIGYLCIAMESILKINKAAPALIMCAVCWTLYMSDAGTFVAALHPEEFSAFLAESINKDSALTNFVNKLLLEHMGDTCEILFFLMGAMTIVEIVDANGGFNFVRDALQTTSKRKLLWRITFMTFFLSAILDNLTTSIVMIMVLRKLVHKKEERMIYASLIILAANSGGAFSPIGDVTTIMLWIKGMITTGGVIREIILPSLISVVVPALILQYRLKGHLEKPETATTGDALYFSKTERNIVFFLGVGGLMFVPVFRFLTGLPPFMGILLVLGLLWGTTEIFFRNKPVDGTMKRRVEMLLSRIDMTTILFFLGILMAVTTLQETGVLTAFGRTLNDVSGGNHYLVTGVIGAVSSIVDNVPLVAGCMGMYDIATPAAVAANPALVDFAVDGLFWQLLAYCAGVGGSMLIIGSAAGVVVMGLEKITFGWYMKNITWIAATGYVAGILCYWLQKAIGF